MEKKIINMYGLGLTTNDAWYTGTNANGDSAVNNIWGKLYTWTSLDTNTDNVINSSDTNLVCGVGYHLPSDAEWTTAENTLFGSNCDAGLNAFDYLSICTPGYPLLLRN